MIKSCPSETESHNSYPNLEFTYITSHTHNNNNDDDDAMLLCILYSEVCGTDRLFSFLNIVYSCYLGVIVYILLE